MKLVKKDYHYIRMHGQKNAKKMKYERLLRCVKDDAIKISYLVRSVNYNIN